MNGVISNASARQSLVRVCFLCRKKKKPAHRCGRFSPSIKLHDIVNFPVPGAPQSPGAELSGDRLWFQGAEGKRLKDMEEKLKKKVLARFKFTSELRASHLIHFYLESSMTGSGSGVSSVSRTFK